jgi:uncharacterized membrane protein
MNTQENHWYPSLSRKKPWFSFTQFLPHRRHRKKAKMKIVTFTSCIRLLMMIIGASVSSPSFTVAFVTPLSSITNINLGGSSKFSSAGQLNNHNYNQMLEQQPQYSIKSSQAALALYANSNSNTQLKASAADLTDMTTSITSATVPIRIQVVLVISSFVFLAGYHIHLFWKENRGIKKTWRQYQADIREDWSKHVRQTEGWLYAIQALRNAISAQTFLATTVLSLLTLITGKIWDILRSTETIHVLERQLLTIQLACIALPMLFSAYQFLQGVRLMTHAGFMFPVYSNNNNNNNNSNSNDNQDNTKVDKIMRQTQNCQWLGLRLMYISLGPICWVVGGSRAFFISSIGLLQFFRSIDRQPEGMRMVRGEWKGSLRM